MRDELKFFDKVAGMEGYVRKPRLFLTLPRFDRDGNPRLDKRTHLTAQQAEVLSVIVSLYYNGYFYNDGSVWVARGLTKKAANVPKDTTKGVIAYIVKNLKLGARRLAEIELSNGDIIKNVLLFYMDTKRLENLVNMWDDITGWQPDDKEDDGVLDKVYNRGYINTPTIFHRLFPTVKGNYDHRASDLLAFMFHLIAHQDRNPFEFDYNLAEVWLGVSKRQINQALDRIFQTGIVRRLQSGEFYLDINELEVKLTPLERQSEGKTHPSEFSVIKGHFIDDPEVSFELHRLKSPLRKVKLTPQELAFNTGIPLEIALTTGLNQWGEFCTKGRVAKLTRNNTTYSYLQEEQSKLKNNETINTERNKETNTDITIYILNLLREINKQITEINEKLNYLMNGEKLKTEEFKEITERENKISISYTNKEAPGSHVSSVYEIELPFSLKFNSELQSRSKILQLPKIDYSKNLQIIQKIEKITQLLKLNFKSRNYLKELRNLERLLGFNSSKFGVNLRRVENLNLCLPFRSCEHKSSFYQHFNSLPGVDSHNESSTLVVDNPFLHFSGDTDELEYQYDFHNFETRYGFSRSDWIKFVKDVEEGNIDWVDVILYLTPKQLEEYFDTISELSSVVKDLPRALAIKLWQIITRIAPSEVLDEIRMKFGEPPLLDEDDAGAVQDWIKNVVNYLLDEIELFVREKAKENVGYKLEDIFPGGKDYFKNLLFLWYNDEFWREGEKRMALLRGVPLRFNKCRDGFCFPEHYMGRETILKTYNVAHMGEAGLRFIEIIEEHVRRVGAKSFLFPNVQITPTTFVADSFRFKPNKGGFGPFVKAVSFHGVSIELWKSFRELVARDTAWYEESVWAKNRPLLQYLHRVMLKNVEKFWYRGLSSPLPQVPFWFTEKVEKARFLFVTDSEYYDGELPRYSNKLSLSELWELTRRRRWEIMISRFERERAFWYERPKPAQPVMVLTSDILFRNTPVVTYFVAHPGTSLNNSVEEFLVFLIRKLLGERKWNLDKVDGMNFIRDLEIIFCHFSGCPDSLKQKIKFLGMLLGTYEVFNSVGYSSVVQNLKVPLLVMNQYVRTYFRRFVPEGLDKFYRKWVKRFLQAMDDMRKMNQGRKRVRRETRVELMKLQSPIVGATEDGSPIVSMSKVLFDNRMKSNFKNETVYINFDVVDDKIKLPNDSLKKKFGVGLMHEEGLISNREYAMMNILTLAAFPIADYFNTGELINMVFTYPFSSLYSLFYFLSFEYMSKWYVKADDEMGVPAIHKLVHKPRGLVNKFLRKEITHLHIPNLDFALNLTFKGAEFLFDNNHDWTAKVAAWYDAGNVIADYFLDNKDNRPFSYFLSDYKRKVDFHDIAKKGMAASIVYTWEEIVKPTMERFAYITHESESKTNTKGFRYMKMDKDFYNFVDSLKYKYWREWQGTTQFSFDINTVFGFPIFRKYYLATFSAFVPPSPTVKDDFTVYAFTGLLSFSKYNLLKDYWGESMQKRVRNYYERFENKRDDDNGILSKIRKLRKKYGDDFFKPKNNDGDDEGVDWYPGVYF